MSGFKIIKSGILTTIQDRGRDGYMDYGITKSGAMDIYSYNWLNRLLENDQNTNCLEIVFGNVELIALCETYICITGADCEFSINNITKDSWQVHKVVNGDSIKIGKLLSGVRAYLGVKDGFKVKKELGSCSTTLKEQIGRDKLQVGEVLESSSSKTLSVKKLQKEFVPNFNEELLLRVVLGYQEESFSKAEKEKFFSTTYTITNEFNRMGCKLRGQKIESSKNGIISEAISFGSVQIPKDGQPIILLNERQTIGGYPKIGSVLPIDCYKLAQRTPNSKVSFKEISLEEAIKVTQEFYSFFKN